MEPAFIFNGFSFILSGQNKFTTNFRCMGRDQWSIHVHDSSMQLVLLPVVMTQMQKTNTVMGFGSVVSKTSVGATPPRVRISVSPPYKNHLQRSTGSRLSCKIMKRPEFGSLHFFPALPPAHPLLQSGKCRGCRSGQLRTSVWGQLHIRVRLPVSPPLVIAGKQAGHNTTHLAQKKADFTRRSPSSFSALFKTIHSWRPPLNFLAKQTRLDFNLGYWA